MCGVGVGAIHCMRELGGCHTLYEGVGGCHTLYGVGAEAIHCMKGRRVPEVVYIQMYTYGRIHTYASPRSSEVCNMFQKEPWVAPGEKVTKL